MPPGTLLQTLNSFLSLNPDVHMLPFTSLTHLTVLYAVSHSLLNHSVAAGQLIACSMGYSVREGVLQGVYRKRGPPQHAMGGGGALPLHYTTVPFQFALWTWPLLSSCIILICNVRAPNLKNILRGTCPQTPLAAVCLHTQHYSAPPIWSIFLYHCTVHI